MALLTNYLLRCTIIALLIFNVWSCSASDSSTGRGAAETTPNIEKKAPVEVFVKPLGKVEIFDPKVFAGVVDTAKKSTVFSAIVGLLEKSYAEPGDYVKAGQLLYRVRPLSGIGYQMHPVLATMTGTLVKKNKSVGQKVLLQDELAVIAQLDEFQTRVHVTADDVGGLKLGQEVAVLRDVDNKDSSVKMVGSVVSVSPQPDHLTGAYEVRIKLECQGAPCKDILELGSFLKVCFKENIRQGLSVKTKYLHGNQSKMLLADRENKARWVNIQAGSVFGEQVEIKGVAAKYFNNDYKLVTSYSKKPNEGDTLVIGSRGRSLQNPLQPIDNKIAGPEPKKNKG